MSDLTKEERRAYARRNESYDAMIEWKGHEKAIAVRRQGETKQETKQPEQTYAVDEMAFYCSNPYQVVKFTQEWRDKKDVVNRSKKKWEPDGLRWAPHRGTMIPIEEWNEDEYQDWRARHYLECFEKVQRLKEKVEAGQLPVIL